MGVNGQHLDIDFPTTEREIEMYDVERLKQLLPQHQLEQLQANQTELSQLEIILQAIKYIRSLQEDLSEKKRRGTDV